MQVDSNQFRPIGLRDLYPSSTGRSGRRVGHAAAIAISFCGLCGCGSSGGGACSFNTAPPLIVTVLDVATGGSVCNATVTAVIGGAHLTLAVHQNGSSCNYELDSGGAGSYTVTATAPGYGTATSSATVTGDPCGRIDETQYLTMKLTANS